MREEDLVRDARPLLLQLNNDESVIGTSTTFIKDKNSYYLECVTLLVKKVKNPKRISNIVKEETGREPVMETNKGFTYLKWEYFIS